MDENNLITSKNVAEWFEKRHDAVLRDIRELLCTEVFRENNYKRVESWTKNSKRTYYITMTVKGFLFLTLGYTGRRLAQRKEFYLEQFTKESEVREMSEVTEKYLGRLEEELYCLETKLIALNKVLKDPVVFETIPPEQQELLRQQYGIMVAYKNILTERLSLLIKEEE